MSLIKETEALKEQFAEAQKREEEKVEDDPVEADSEEEEVAVEDGSENEKEEVKDEEAKEPQEPQEPKEESAKSEEKPDDAAFARLRREAAASKKAREEAERELAELRKPKEESTEQESPAVAEELQRVIQDHRETRAEREFQIYEAQTRQSKPDYDPVTAEYANALAASFKVQNPRLSNVQLAEMTKKSLLEKAGYYARQGYENPVEELYHEAKELGFTGSSFKKQESAKEPKPDMAKVAENRKRSAGMTGAAGREEGLISKKTAAEMSPAEWKALNRTERQRLMSM